MAQFKLGVIGTGIMGERMLRAALEHAGDIAAIAGVWDPSDAARAHIAKSLPGLAIAASAEALIAASDCVYIASPPASHIALATSVMAAGKAVFCEKPLATDLAAAEAFVAFAKGKRAAVNFPMATSFSAEHMRTWLADGIIGTPQSLSIEVAFATWPRGWQQGAASWLDGRAEGGFTREVVSHFLFLTGRLLGPATLGAHQAAFPIADRSERTISAQLSAGGIPIALTGAVGTTAKDDHNLMTLTGDKGRIRIRDWAIAEHLVNGAWQPAGDAMPQDRARPLGLTRQLAGVAAMVRGDAHPLATLEEALAVQKIVEGILA
jgi:predicted dehydrogenase